MQVEVPSWGMFHPSAPLAQMDFRIGEADNPGPQACLEPSAISDTHDLLHIGTTNPSGLRRKETEAIALGPGIWTFSETQLSSQTAPTTIRQLKWHARQQRREIHVHTGAPVAVRSNSSWAGSWSGVLTLSDCASQRVQFPMPAQCWESGRILCTRHVANGLSLLVTAVYGFPRGPTYPAAYELSDQLLDSVTTEIVIGGRGPRFVCGDFNATPGASATLKTFEIWERFGWRSVQNFAAECLGWTKVPTCKGRTERDLIYASPEALSLLQGLRVTENFADHSTLAAIIAVPRRLHQLQRWPRPQPIPWEDVSSTWAPPGPVLPETTDSTAIYAGLWHQLERSLTGHVSSQPANSLTQAQRGRAKRLTPASASFQQSFARPSREGEVRLQSDLTGTSVRLWFRQLRRLQSMRHALHAGNMSDQAQLYRAELWTSICRAKGFRDGWQIWWDYHRAHGRHLANFSWPSSVPDARVIDLLFDAFQDCFAHFEAWHIKQRSKCLRSKHDHTMKSLFRDLKPPAKEQATLLTLDTQHVVQAGANGLELQPPPPTAGIQLWSISSPHSDFQSSSSLPCQERPMLTAPGQVASCTQVLSGPHEVHDAILAHWIKHWNQRVQPTEEEWSRMTGFLRHHLRPMDFRLRPFDETTWHHTLKKYKAHAARGADGISHHDFRRLPPEYTRHIVLLLQQIEAGQAQWPMQVLQGLCIALAKVADARTPSQHRPICIFSLLYRTWSAARSRQLCRSLANLLPPDLLGFAPGKEAGQYWMSLQAAIELAMQSSTDLCGIGTDLRRAFNMMSRPLLQELTTTLRVPLEISRPWMAFLAHSTRRFQCGEFVSAPTHTTVGVPEGDALSVFAMLQLDYAYHCYMQHFQPSVRAHSYVDNLSLLESSAGALIQSWATMETFFSLAGMEVDPGKTYAWALCGSTRKSLKALGFMTKLSATELGGALHMSHRHTETHVTSKADALQAKWQRLKRSLAPHRQKQAALPIAFWASALHGTAATEVSQRTLSSLRTSAIKSLGWAKAGANSTLRLTLAVDMLCDPGYYLLRTTVHTFRRLAAKDPLLWTQWHIYMSRYDGAVTNGPFSALLQRLTAIQWQVRPPFLVDHDGEQLDLLHTDPRLLDILLTEAWLQAISHTAMARPSMSDAQGLDAALIQFDFNRRTALDSSLISSLQCGAFFDAHHQAKFDKTKEGLCRFCGSKDTHGHWPRCHGYKPFRPQPDWPESFSQWPQSLTHHLLPSRNPYDADLKAYFGSLHDCSWDFHATPSHGTQHIFTDGSFFPHDSPWLRLASWSAILASSQTPLASGPVPGLFQQGDVAELWGILASLQWGTLHMVAIHIWSDSKFIVNNCNYLLSTRHVPPAWENQTLWNKIRDMIDTLEDALPAFSWVPAHTDQAQARDAFEEWKIHWNDVADQQAVRANKDRGPLFAQLYDRARSHHDEQLSRLRMLYAFYGSIAKTPHSRPKNEGCEDPAWNSFQDFPGMNDLLSDQVPIDWETALVQAHEVTPFYSFEFAQQLTKWLLQQETDRVVAFQVCDLEILFLLLEADLRFPVGGSLTGGCARIRDLMIRPTVSELHTAVKKTLTSLIRVFNAESHRLHELDRTCIGIHRPVQGLRLALDPCKIQSAQRHLGAFLSTRPYRTCADLARPPPVVPH